MRQTFMIPALVAGIVLLTANSGGAEPYRDAARHFTLEVPDGWEPDGPVELAKESA